MTVRAPFHGQNLGMPVKQSSHLANRGVALRRQRSEVRIPSGAPSGYVSDPETWVTERT
jgi:hypothetical protein